MSNENEVPENAEGAEQPEQPEKPKDPKAVNELPKAEGPNRRNADGSLWTVAQWKEFSTKQLANPQEFNNPELAQRIKDGHQMILDAPDDFTPEQMDNLANHAAASVMALAVEKKK